MIEDGPQRTGPSDETSPAPPDGRDGPHVFADDLDVIELADETWHHLDRVLRLRDGDTLTVSDGLGSWRVARVARSGQRHVIEPAGPIIVCPPTETPIAIAFALTKSNKPEFTVQKLTELGVDRVVVFGAQHSVVRWVDDKRSRHAARLDAVIRSASEQSRRCTLPDLTYAEDLAEAVGLLGGLVLADRGGERVDVVRHRAVAIGPEGGWSAAERRSVERTVRLPGNVLRAETAAIVAATLLCAQRECLA